MYELLSLASKLECLEVHLRRQRSNPSAGPNVVTLANVSRFSFWNEDRMASEFFDYLALPSLRYLTWINFSFDRHSTTNSRSVISLILRSQCSLSSLHISAISNLIELLQLFPALEEFSGSFVDLGQWESTIEALGFQDSTQLLPNLRALEVVYPPYQSEKVVELDHFADIVASRWRPEDMSSVSTLKHIKVIFYQDISSPDFGFARLRKYVEEGLDISFEERI